MSNDFDVIVVGAGYAGMTAARELGTRGKRTLILEGRDRVGGRTWTDSFAGHPVEMGGTWVHWLQPHVWAEVTRYDMPIVEDAPAERCVLASGSGLASFDFDPAFARQDELAQRYFAGAVEFLDRPHQPAFRDAIRELDALSISDRFDQLGFDDDDRGWLDGLFATLAGSPSSEGAFTMVARWWALSGWNFGLLWDILARYRLEGGTVSLLTAMLSDSGADLRLESPVASIADSGGGVEVTTRSGQRFTASSVVVATPANVWRTIEFTPGLEPARAAAAARGIGVPHGSKCWAHIRGDVGRVLAQPPEGYPIGFAFTYAELDDGQLLACFSGTPSFDPTDPEQIADGVRLMLPEAEVVDVRGHDWIDDEFSLGGWAYLRPGQLTESLAALQQPHGRIAFATSDIASGWSGYIDGAIEAGIRAARQTLAAGSASPPRAAALSR